MNFLKNLFGHKNKKKVDVSEVDVYFISILIENPPVHTIAMDVNQFGQAIVHYMGAELGFDPQNVEYKIQWQEQDKGQFLAYAMAMASHSPNMPDNWEDYIFYYSFTVPVSLIDLNVKVLLVTRPKEKSK